MRRLLGTLRKYFLPHGKRISAAILLSLAGLVLNASALTLLAAITQTVASAAGLDTGLAPEVASASPSPTNFDIVAWYDYLSSVLNLWLETRGLLWTLGILAGMYLVAIVLYTLSEIGVEYMVWSVRGLAAQRYMRDLFAHLIGLSMDFFNRSKAGELSSRITHDVERYMDELGKIAKILLTSLPLAIFYWVALIRTNAELTLAAVVAFGSSYFLVQTIGRVARNTAVKLGDATAGIEATLQESFSGVTLVKAYGSEKVQLDRLDTALANSLRPMILDRVITRVTRPINRLLQDVPAVSVLLFGAFLILSGRLQISTLILVVYLMRQVRGPTTDLIGGLYFAFQIGTGFAHRIQELQAHQPSVLDGQKTITSFGRTLDLDEVSFTYEASDVVLESVSLTIEKGEVVALVGPSGAGKSTLVSLLLRFYDPISGQIKLDGQDISAYQLASYRQLFGVVTQETILFNDSVSNNIAYAMPAGAVTPEEIEEAARIANAHEFITELPDGYETIVGDRGLRLSGGQRQRLALARAVLRDPEILILDEATSSLDSVSELLVQEAIERLLTGRTAVVVAHRLSTIRNATRIVVMDQGRIVETGTHESLLANGGLYRLLYESQYMTDAAAAG